jgi:hypothetical protein
MTPFHYRLISIYGLVRRKNKRTKEKTAEKSKNEREGTCSRKWCFKEKKWRDLGEQTGVGGGEGKVGGVHCMHV